MKSVGWKGVIGWAVVLWTVGWVGSAWRDQPFDGWNWLAMVLIGIVVANNLQKLAEHIDDLTDKVARLERLAGVDRE